MVRSRLAKVTHARVRCRGHRGDGGSVAARDPKTDHRRREQTRRTSATVEPIAWGAEGYARDLNQWRGAQSDMPPPEETNRRTSATAAGGDEPPPTGANLKNLRHR
eukprot:3200913-Pyramimonas_sp.AAC.1